MEVTVVIVTLKDRLLLTLIISHADYSLQRQPDSSLLFLVDYLVHKSNGNGKYILVLSVE